MKTAIIERECFNKLTKLILEGPKYLFPLIEEIDVRSLFLIRYGVTCSLSEGNFESFQAFSNDLKLKIYTAKPSGYVFGYSVVM